jgi:hypothetical protein
MLFLSMILVTIGYAALYATLHGDWQFWQYFFPRTTPTAATTAASTSASTATAPTLV